MSATPRGSAALPARPTLPTRPGLPTRRRPGVTLLELALVLALTGVLSAIAIPAFGRHRDRIAVLHARQALMDAFSVARDVALAGAAPVAVLLDGGAASITVRLAADTIQSRMLGVALRATRDSMSYGPDGLGVGAANLTAVLQRGSAVDTVVISRLGRVR